MKNSKKSACSALRSGIRFAVVPFVAAAMTFAATGPTPAQAAPKMEKVTIILDWIPLMPQHMGFWLAKSRGWYADAGLDVTIRGGRGSGRAIQIVTAGKADFGNAAASSLVQAVAKQNVPVKMVAVFFQKDTSGIGFMKSTGIKTPKDLEGRKIGLVPGGIHSLLWPSFARAAGIDASKVQILSTNYRFNYQQLAAGQFDAVNWVVHGAGAARLEAQGKPFAGFPFADYLPLIGHGIIVANKTIDQRPQVVERFVQTTSRAWADMIRNPEKAVSEASKIINKNIEKSPPEEFIKNIALKAIPEHMQSTSTKGKPVGWSDPKNWQRMIDMLAKYDKFPRKPDVEEVMSNRFLR